MSSIIYGAAAIVSLALLVGYLVFAKKKDVWLLFLFISVLLVNAGYFSISMSNILEEALLAKVIACSTLAPSLSLVTSAPTKVSPAAVVSTAFTFLQAALAFAALV